MWSPNFAVGVLVSASICCCGTRTRLPSQFTNSPVGAEKGKAPAVSRSRNDEDVDRAIREIAYLRGWPPNLDVRVAVARSDEITNALLADVHAQMTPDVQKAQQDFLIAFGLVPLEFDFERDVIRRFTLDVSGLYCVTCQRILVAQTADARAARRTLRHELVHAFQDSRYGLGAKVRWQQDRGDYIAALHTLAEGEATCIDLALDDPRHAGCLDAPWVDSPTLASSDFLAGVPRVVRDALIAPYSEGVRYVRRLLLQGGWTAVEHAWNGHLQSTRQLQRDTVDLPQVITLAPPPEFAHCRQQYLDVVGEQQLRYLVSSDTHTLDAILPFIEGDRMAVWECPSQTLAAMRVQLREETATRALAHLLVQSLGLPPPRSNASCAISNGRAVSVVWHGHDIVIASVLLHHGQSGAASADSCPLLEGIGQQVSLSTWTSTAVFSG